MNEKQLCAIYIRVSTEEQAKHGYSIDSQKEVCASFAQTKGYEVDHVSLSMTLKQYNIEILSATESNSKDASGNLQRNLSCILSQLENEQKSERVTNAMKQAMESGRWLWRAPFGYFYDSNIGNIVPKEKESKIVKTIFEKLATGCYSQANILSELKKQGVELYPTHMCKILRNPIYCGYMVKEEWFDEPVKGLFTPLVSESLFNTAQDILDGKKPVIAPHDFNNPDYPLKQFLLCPYCGKPLTGSTSTGRNKKKFYYYSCYNKKCTHKFSMSKDKIEKSFIELLKQIKPKEELLNFFKIMVSDVYKELTKEQTTRNSQLKRQLDELVEEKKEIIRSFSKKKIEEEDYNLIMDDLKSKEQEIKSNIQHGAIPQDDFEKCLKSSLSVIQNIDNAWQQSVYSIKKNLQNLIFPNGLNADFSSFQNTEIASIFTKIGALSAPNYKMVPPSEFESLSTP